MMKALASVPKSFFNSAFLKLHALSNKKIDQEVNLRKLHSIEEKASKLPNISIFGQFIDTEHYAKSIDLINYSSNEVQNRKNILLQKILPSLMNKCNFLDIGICSGELTKLIGDEFKNITVLDPNLNFLKNLPVYHWRHGTLINKVNKCITEATFAEEKYDLILMSHIIYYIPKHQQIFVMNKLYAALNKKGKIVIIYNDGADRAKLVEYFKGVSSIFKDFIVNINEIYSNVKIYDSIERIKTRSLNSMLHIAGVCLNDAATICDKNKLSEYLETYNFDGQYYNLTMLQKFIIIEK